MALYIGLTVPQKL